MKRIVTLIVLAMMLMTVTGCGSQSHTRLSPNPHQEALGRQPPQS